MKIIFALKIALILVVIRSVDARRRRARFGRPSTRRMANFNQNDAVNAFDQCRLSCQSRPLQKLTLLNTQ